MRAAAELGAQIGCQDSNIGPGTAEHTNVQLRRVEASHLDLVKRDPLGLTRNDLPGSGQLVKRHAVHLHRAVHGRHLLDVSEEIFELSFDFALTRQLAVERAEHSPFEIEGVRLGAEHDGSVVALGSTFYKRDEFGRSPDRKWQNPRCLRVKSA